MGALACAPSGGPDTGTGGTTGTAGIWQSGMGLVADGSDIYFAAGNGAYDTTNKGAQLGISLGRLQLTSTGFKVMDWFTPSAAKSMNDQDLDYTTAPVLLPNPRVILMGGKDQYLNVFDPANLGKYNAGGDANIQKLTVSGHSHGGPVYWNGPSGPTIYLWPETANLRAYRFTGTRINTTAVSQYTTDSPTHPGGTLSLSANGAAAGTGVVWATLTSTRVDTTSGHQGDAWHYLVPGAFYAFDAANLATPIWTSTANKSRDDLGSAGEVQRADRCERQGLRREPARPDVRHVVDGIREAAGLRPASLIARVARAYPGARRYQATTEAVVH